MKKIVLSLAIATFLMVGCVSNKAFRVEREKVAVLETRQNQQDTELEVVRKDILVEKEKIESLIISMGKADQKLMLLDPMQAEISAQGEDLAYFQDEMAGLKDVSADLINDLNAMQTSVNDKTQVLQNAINEQAAAIDYVQKTNMENQQRLGKDLDDFISDTDFVMDAFTDKLVELDRYSKTLATKDELGEALEENQKVASTLAELTEEVQNFGEGGVGRAGDLQAEIEELRDVVLDMYSEMVNSGFVASEEIESSLNAESQKRVEMMNDLLSRLEEVENELQGKISKETGYRDVVFEDLDTRLDQFENEISALRQEQLTSKNEVSGLRQRVEAISSEVSGISSDLAPVIRQEKEKREKERQLSINAQYKIALNLYNKGKYEEAIIKFEDFLEQFPNESLSVNAYYWIGESYYAGKKWNTALDYFNRVINNYPEHHKATDAKLKAGMCLYNLDLKYQANEMFQELKDNYPKYNRIDLVNKYLRLTK